MFKYKTRTETINGCKFYEQDILLFDYLYSGDCVVEFVVDYNSPGFGLFLAKESNIDIVDSEDIYIFKLGDENEYQIINKQLLKQVYLRDEYILPGSDIRFPAKDLKLVFKFIDNCKIEAFVINKISSGEELETMLFEYEIPYFIDKYKIGVYSNSGNTLKHATIKSEAPSNWISNIVNGNGGRISWIKNGFKIENCEHDCEVECQNIKLDPGKYYFDYKCNNQDMKCYIYLSEFENTNDRRPTERILQTRIDDAKNILNYSNNSFELKEESLINIRFKGKEGTVENIAIKRKKLDSFVETDYSTTVREASYINLNINNIKKVEMEAEIISFPLNEVDEEIDYSLFSSGNNNIDKHDFEYHDYTKILNYGIDVENGIVSINSDTTDKLKEEIQN